MKTRVCKILAFLLVCVMTLGLLTACPASTSEEAWKEARQESIARRESREASLAAAQTEKDPSAKPSEVPTEAGNDGDGVIPGKWVLTGSGCDADAGKTDGDGQYVTTYDASLYRHCASHSYTPMEADYMLEDDDPWTESFVCTCSTMPETIFPETPFSVTIEARVEHSDAQVHSHYCYFYCDSPRITLDAGGHDYANMAYAVYAGSSPGPTWGHALDAPWSNGMSDTITITAPTVTKSNERGLSSFRLEFKSSAGKSWFEYTWVPD
ncbi:MAG: hypothetical protein IJG45_02295 [Oscillospiraceae bacterium]|nr:hypothetical protein [Oscillospiraceae bacterium]